MRQTWQVLRNGFSGRPYEAAAMLAMAAIYFLSFFQRVAVPGTIFNKLQSDLSLSAAAVTGLGAVYLYIYAGMQMVVGYAADRFGGLRSLLGGSAILAVGAVLFPLSVNLPMLYVSRAMIGFGGSFIFICMLKELDLLFGPRQFARLYGPFLLFGSMGALFATLPLERLVHAIGWRPSFVLTAVVTCIAVIALFWLAKRIKRHEPAEVHSLGRAVSRVVRRKRVWLVIVPGAVIFLIYFCLQATIGKKMLQDVTGMGSAAAASVPLAMMVVCLTLTLMSGSILAWVGHRRKPVMIASAIAAVVGAAALSWAMRAEGPTWLIAGAMVLSAAAVGLGPAFLCSLKELCPSDAVGMAVGICNSLSYMIVAIGTNVAGLVLDRFREQAVTEADGTIVYPAQAYAWLFDIATALAIAAWVCTMAAPETHGIQADESDTAIGRSVA